MLILYRHLIFILVETWFIYQPIDEFIRNNFPELVITCIGFFSLNDIPKQLAYSGKYSIYLLSNFTKTLCLTLACINAPMKSNWCNLALFLALSAKKYFRFLIDAVGAQMYPRIYLFCKYPLTTILNFTLWRLPSDWIFPFYTSLHSVTGYFSGSSIRKVWMLIKYFM